MLKPMLRFAVLLFCAGLALPGLANDAATVSQLAGVLSVRQLDGAVKLLALNSTVRAGDLLSTGPKSYARLKFVDGGELTLRPNTQLRIDDFRFEQDKPEQDNAFFRLLKGGLRAVTGLVGKRNNLAAYKMTTPTATIGIRGTNYGALYCQDDCADYQTNTGQVPANGLHVDVHEGQIVVSNALGSQQYEAGQFGFVGPNQPPLPVPASAGVPIATDRGINRPPETVLGEQADRQNFECTME